MQVALNVIFLIILLHFLLYVNMSSSEKPRVWPYNKQQWQEKTPVVERREERRKEGRRAEGKGERKSTFYACLFLKLSEAFSSDLTFASSMNQSIHWKHPNWFSQTADNVPQKPSWSLFWLSCKLNHLTNQRPTLSQISANVKRAVSLKFCKLRTHIWCF